ncbi:DNA-binding transcriptional regulator [Luteolibacter sp. LG18]|uniref:AraC family transcriptional regulator n=1 Tax=Luteolibacter sp. LG18 TaxID=2819286 RepID=UPI002B3146CE|nr:XylR family transcriptional regulator [Luteolibacter sp. LG18]
MATLLKLAVVYPTSIPWMAEIIDGIRRYGLQYGGWQILTCPPTLEASGERSRSLSSLVGWKGDAAIAAVRNAEDRKIVRKLGIPVVNLSQWESEAHGVPRVSVDNYLAGRLAAEHLLERGIRELAYLGWKNVHYSNERLRGFASRAKEAGLHCVTKLDAAEGTSARTLADELHELGAWLSALPRPCGIFAVQDYRAQLVVEACASVGLRVPRDVAIIGMDDDAIVCGHSTPTLTSVRRNSGQVGWEMAALIDRMIRGDRPDTMEILVPPEGIVERQSTDMFHHGDEVVQLAVSFMLRNLKDAPKVQTIADHAGVSKRTLETRFRSATGKSPHEYLTTARIERAMKLMQRPTQTNLRNVAAACGFASYPAFVAAFQGACGKTPGDYQRQFRQARGS